jgi:uncharacterized membrane protein
MNQVSLQGSVGALLLAVTLLLTLLLLPSPGTGDVGIFLVWMRVVHEQGLLDGYASVVANFPRGLVEGLATTGGGEYPPLAYVILYAARHLGELAGLTPFASFKLALFVFHWSSVALVLVLSGSLLLAAAFSASILLSGIGLGYMDICLAPWLIGAFWMIRSGRPVLGLGLFMVSVLVKWQPLIIAPFLLLHLLGISDLRSAWAAIGGVPFRRFLALAAAAAVLLGLAFGHWPVTAFLHAAAHPYLSGNAFNLPRLVGFVSQLLTDPAFAADSELSVTQPPAVLLLPFKTLFWFGYAAILFLAARSEKTLENGLLFAVAGFVSYCTLNTGVHENHWFVAFVLALVLALHAPSAANRALALLLAVMLNVNLFTFYGIMGDPVLPIVVGIDLSVPFSLLYCTAWLIIILYVGGSTRRVAGPRLASPARHPAIGAANNRDA